MFCNQNNVPVNLYLTLIIKGKINENGSIGRRQNSWLKDLRRWHNCSSADISRAAVFRIQIALWIANLLSERVVHEKKKNITLIGTGDKLRAKVIEYFEKFCPFHDRKLSS